MKRSTDRLLTTHPGRLPDPTVRDAVMDARLKGDRATFEALTKQGIGEMFALQRAAGVDVMSDGEFWKARDDLPVYLAAPEPHEDVESLSILHRLEPRIGQIQLRLRRELLLALIIEQFGISGFIQSSRCVRRRVG